MSAVLALAACCKCHAIMDEAAMVPETWSQILELLVFADRNYGISLRQMQAGIANMKHYDEVLANSYVMALYGFASHSIRIRLAQTEGMVEFLPTELLPVHFEWIYLIRAAHLAYAGLVGEGSEISFLTQEEGRFSVNNVTAASGMVCAEDNLSPMERPAKQWKEILLPLLVTTSIPALEKLGFRSLEITASTERNAPFGGADDFEAAPNPEISYNAEVKACLAALKILRGLFAEIVLADNPRASAMFSSDQLGVENPFPPSGRLLEVSPWLWSYLTDTRAAAPSRPLRRAITAFITRVPTDYLNLVQSTLESTLMQTKSDKDEARDGVELQVVELTGVQQLALDIFAHWLALVMVLDGIWWVGSIGTWELKRVATVMQNRGLVRSYPDIGNDWWPAVMIEVAEETGDR